MKDCQKIHPLLPLYRENQLSAREKGIVEKHIKNCPEAREELKQLDRLNKTLKSIPEPKMPRDLHDKIMARLHGKPVAVKPLWPRASWGLAAAASLAFIFLVQNFDWMGNKNSEIVLKPASSASSTKASAPAPSEADMTLKSQTNRPANPQTALYPAAKEIPETDNKTQVNEAAPMAPLQMSSIAPQTNFSLEPAKRSKKMAMEETKGSAANTGVSSSVSASPPQADFAMVQNNEAAGNTTTTTASNYSDIRSSVLSLKSNSTQIWSGDNSPTNAETQQLLMDSVSFTAQWNTVYPQGQSLPVVDFTTQSVIFITAGEEPTSGYSIRISQLEDQPNQLIAHYRVIASQNVTGTVITHPWLMQIIPKPAKPVVFIKDE